MMVVQDMGAAAGHGGGSFYQAQSSSNVSTASLLWRACADIRMMIGLVQKHAQHGRQTLFQTHHHTVSALTSQTCDILYHNERNLPKKLGCTAMLERLLVRQRLSGPNVVLTLFGALWK